MELPSKTSVFDFTHEGELTGKKYEGQFTVIAALNMGQRHALEMEKTRLLGNYLNPTDALAGMAIILGNLRTKIIDSPEWWRQSNGGLEIMDEDVLVALHNKIKEVEAKWREDLKEKAKVALEKTPATSQ